MSNSIDTRSSFFPNSKPTSNKGLGKSEALAKSYMKRNTPDRVSELGEMARKDSKVEIPDAIKDFSRIKKAVDAAPEIDNSDKIARLKSQIQAGTYQVDYDALADKILSQEF